MYRIALAAGLGLALAACAGLEPRASGAAPTTADAGDELGALYYHLLVAELASREHDFDQALEHYLAALPLSDDPQVAAAASRLALQQHADQAGLGAARRWVELVPDDGEAQRVLGLFAFRAGNHETALAAFRAALAAPELGGEEGLSRLGLALSQERDRDAALALLERLVDERADEAHAHYVLAQVTLRLGDAGKALDAVRQAIRLEPDWRAPQLLKVRLHLVGGDSESALRQLEAVLADSPEDYDLRLYYARTLLSMERTEPALAQFELLLLERPADAQVLYGAALLALELGEHAVARRHLLKLVNVGERLDEGYYFLGRLAEAEEDAKGALRWYREAANAGHLEAQFRAVLLLAEQGELEAARQRLARLRQQQPEEVVRAYLVEGELLRRAGRNLEALAVYDDALERLPEAVDLLYSRALVNVALDRLAAAERDLRALLELRPQHAHALNALGYTLVDRTDRHREGYQLIRQAYELKPDNAAIIDSLGWAYYRLGDLELALRYLEDAYERGADPEIAAHLVEVLWHLGERGAAERVLAEALELFPEAAILTETRGRLR